MINKHIFESVKQDWETPEEFYKKLDEEFHFDFDTCPISNYTNGGTVNGLACDWGNVNYCNPPYKTKEQDAWVKKGFEEWQKGKTVVFLIPARTGTKRFHKYILPHAHIRFIEGRLKFKGAKNVAPFDSMICIFKAGETIT